MQTAVIYKKNKVVIFTSCRGKSTATLRMSKNICPLRRKSKKSLDYPVWKSPEQTISLVCPKPNEYLIDKKADSSIFRNRCNFRGNHYMDKSAETRKMYSPNVNQVADEVSLSAVNINKFYVKVEEFY